MIPWGRSNAYQILQTLKWDNASASLMVPRCRSDACKRNTNVELIQPSASLMVRCSTACKTHIHTFTWDNTSASPMVPWCRSNAYVKAQCKLWVETMPRPRLWYPDVAQMDVKHNTTIKLRQSLGGTYDTLMSLRCVYNTMQALSWDNPSASLMVPWRRSDACRTQWWY